MGPFDRFNDRAKRVLALAQDEAIRFNHNYIGVEHLLLGLVREGEGVAARVLDSLGIDLSKARSSVEVMIGRGKETTSPSNCAPCSINRAGTRTRCNGSRVADSNRGKVANAGRWDNTSGRIWRWDAAR